jgi:hypothetical protein
MQREIALYFAAFLSEKQRKQEIGAEASPEKGEQPGPSAWPVTRRGASVPRQELRPDLYVPVLDACQAGVDVASLCIAFRGSKDAIEESGVRLVLPVVLEVVKVGGGRCLPGGHA